MTQNQPSIFLSVVIPAYNEQSRLTQTLDSVRDYLNGQSYTWELAVVDDGSSDQTAQIVERAAVSDANILLLQYGQNRGKGFAVRHGMLHTTGKCWAFDVELLAIARRRGYRIARSSNSLDQLRQLQGHYQVIF
jgi:glycosyltransferase involved in cell wall biosynthesis